MRKLVWGVLAASVLAAVFTLALGPALVERSMNRVWPERAFPVPERAARLHRELVIADLHADTLLWARDPLERAGRGQVDLPRLLEGNVALQVFSSVTKSPRGQNLERNTADSDRITALALVQRWPPRTWDSLIERALHQAARLEDAAQRSGGRLVLIRDRDDLAGLLARREAGETAVGALFGTEGLHALEGELTNLGRLHRAGLRTAGLHHFFDNALGGSLHGQSGAGLTAFGRKAVRRMNALGIVVDVAHSSPAVVRDVLEVSTRPVIVSHGGLRGACDTPRNLDDELARAIAEHGGLIGIGYWEAAVCDVTPAGIAASIRYAVDTLGVDRVALGSDFDGAVETAFDAAELAALTAALIEAGLDEAQIRKVMGGNAVAFFAAELLPGD